MHLKQLMPFIGQLPLNKMHDGALEAFKAARKLEDIRTKSINNALQVVRRILNLAARSWRDEHGLTWIETAPLITMLPVRDARKPYPLDWDEQRKFYQRLPGHLARMALYKVNTGTREQEVCQLRWDWEVTVPKLKTSVFIVPGNIVKNREDRLIVHNDIAQSVIEAVRGKHDTFVFTYQGRPLKKMNNTAWKHAWKAVGLPVSDAYLRGPHNLKHTLGRQLCAAGVPLETRKVGRNAAGLRRSSLSSTWFSSDATIAQPGTVHNRAAPIPANFPQPFCDARQFCSVNTR